MNWKQWFSKDSGGKIWLEMYYYLMLSKDIFRDMIQKLRRQSVKGKSSLKGKFGLSNKSSTYRSKSFIVSPTQEVSEFKETQR